MKKQENKYVFLFFIFIIVAIKYRKINNFNMK